MLQMQAITWKTTAKDTATKGTFEGGMAEEQTHRQLVTQFVWLRQTAPMPLGMLAKRAAGTRRHRALLMASETTTRTRKCKGQQVTNRMYPCNGHAVGDAETEPI